MNMKIVVIVLFLIAVSGLGFWVLGSRNKPSQPETVEVATSNEAAGGGSLFTSIKDAISKSLSLECNFTNMVDLGEAEGKKDIKVTAYIKNGAVRVRSTYVADDIAHVDSDMILKDKKLYVWSPKTGGFVMELPEAEVSSLPKASGSSTNDFSETLEDLEKFKDSCKPAVVDDGLFVPPADVKFQDLTQMMQQLPSAAPAASVDPEQVKKLMEQYSEE